MNQFSSSPILGIQGDPEMTINKENKRSTALVIGISLLVMAVAAGIAFGAIHSTLIDISQAEQTMDNLRANLSQWYMEILFWVVIIITDLLVSWGIFHYFRNENMGFSAMTAGLRVIYTVILAAAVSQLVAVSSSVQGGNTQRVMLLLTRFDRIWSFGLIVFGIHLILLSVASFRYENKVLGILLLAAGVSYLLIHTMEGFLPRFSDFTGRLESILAIPMTLGEMVFALWMIIRGGKTKRKAVS
ncbi:MAG: hypothetical protein CVV48_09095 [Spirochaetae bacterium HGW-Spirochaetae-4]|jgi:hypothetical protein|nr:MAG: hypothetical protein CVV48_09095 [Spirochaetae bacterium HGW-Spirochaetae-4]